MTTTKHKHVDPTYGRGALVYVDLTEGYIWAYGSSGEGRGRPEAVTHHSVRLSSCYDGDPTDNGWVGQTVESAVRTWPV